MLLQVELGPGGGIVLILQVEEISLLTSTSCYKSQSKLLQNHYKEVAQENDVNK